MTVFLALLYFRSRYCATAFLTRNAVSEVDVLGFLNCQTFVGGVERGELEFGFLLGFGEVLAV